MRSINRPSSITTRYIQPRDLDMSNVEMPGYISWERTSRGIKLETSGVLIDNGVQAILSVYPEARVYSDGGDAFMDRDDPRNKAV